MTCANCTRELQPDQARTVGGVDIHESALQCLAAKEQQFNEERQAWASEREAWRARVEAMETRLRWFHDLISDGRQKAAEVEF